MSDFPNKQSNAAGAIPVWNAPPPAGSGRAPQAPVNIISDTTTLVHTGPGVFYGLGVNTPHAGATAKVYDGIDASGTLLGTFSLVAAGPNNAVGGGYDFTTGLTIVTAGGPTDITVSYGA